MSQVTDSSVTPLLNSNGAAPWLDLKKELLASVKSTLDSAVKLMDALSGQIFLRKGDGKLVVVRKNNTTGLPLEKQIAVNCMNDGVTRTFYRAEDIHVIDTDQVVGRTTNCYIVAPLASQNGPFGAILLKDKKISGYFNVNDQKLLDTFCQTLGSLIENSLFGLAQNDRIYVNYSLALENLLKNNYLYRQNQEDAFQLSEIIKVSKMINSSLDLQSLLEAIMDSAKHVLKSEGSSLMLIDNQTNELYFNVISGEKERALREIRIPLGVGIAGMCAKEQKAFIINDAQNDPRVYKMADQAINFTTRNLLCAPLMVKDKIIGVIEVINSLGKDEFSANDLDLFMSFSDQAALAIHNRDLIDNLRKTNLELKKRIHELSSLHEVSKVLISARTEKDLFDSIVHILVNELEVEKASILVYSDEEAALEIVSQFGLPREIASRKYISITKSLAGIAFSDNKTIHETNIGESVYGTFSNPDRYSTGSFIIHPLSLNGKPFGLVCVGDRVDGSPLEDEDARLVSTITAQIIKGYENFILNREMILKKAAEKELDMASTIQKNILPKVSSESVHYQMGVKSVPAKTMGGDFYDYWNHEHISTFVVADVSGKSLPAALFMAVSASIIRTIFRTTAIADDKPEDILAKANDLVYENSESGMFVTTFLVNYNHDTGEALYASAGHNEQLIFRAASQTFEILGGKGSPLGVIPTKVHGAYRGGAAKLEKDDILILYTDGVVEAINEVKEEYGMVRFQTVLAKSAKLHPSEIVKRVYREVLEFAGNEPQFDDFTLLIVKRT